MDMMVLIDTEYSNVCLIHSYCTSLSDSRSRFISHLFQQLKAFVVSGDGTLQSFVSLFGLKLTTRLVLLPVC